MSELSETRRRSLVAGATALLAAAALSGCAHNPGMLGSPMGPGQGPGPVPAVEQPPPGMAQVQVVSDFEDQTWDVFAGQDHVCTTPCNTWLDPRRSIFLQARGNPRDEIYLPGLGQEAWQARNAVVVASGSCHGKYVNGVVFTSLGGMGLITGITLTAIGCSDTQRRGGMCTAGLITGGISLPVTAIFIWMLVDSGPKADVFPIYQSQPAPGQTPVKVGLGPAGISGTF